MMHSAEQSVIRRAPMGWNSWDCYGAGVTEDTVRKNAEWMAKNLKPYGWEYVVVDIQWSGPEAKTHDYIPFQELAMDEYGRLIPAVNRFPSAAGGQGFRPLAEYIHSLGLKFGIHIMRGIPRLAVHRNLPVYGSEYTADQVAQASNICEWNPDMYGLNPEHPGSRAYYDSIFALYAEWGVDFIKLDDICREMPRQAGELQMISASLRSCGREMVLSISPGPALPEYAGLYRETSNMWRITDDFWDRWELLYDMFARAERWAGHTGAGHWPDADMLPIGPILQDYDPKNRTRFTPDEQVTMMTLWCIFRSPLMIGGDLTGFDEFTRSLVTRTEILAMHQNARHAHQVWRKKDEQRKTEYVLWTAVNAAGGQYAAVFNLSDDPGNGEAAEIEFSLDDLEIDGAGAKMTELWSGTGTEVSRRITVQVPPHGAKAFLLVPAT